jgi:hypothetical protein
LIFRIRMNYILTFLTCIFSSIALYGQNDNFLFKNPLSFYNTDILSYLQVLHKNQQYEKMAPFFTGPVVEGKSAEEFAKFLADEPFGYSMKRSGIRELESRKSWSITYTRTILGTEETFKMDCVLERDTCRVVLTQKSAKLIFR